MSQKTITIRKYKNRKLYDQKRHCYITLADVLDMFQKDIDFCVIDPEDQDITQDIVVQSVVSHSLHDDKLKKYLLQYAKTATIISSQNNQQVEQTI
jgi:polyhydroxyalkanoate synthesis regulator protein